MDIQRLFMEQEEAPSKGKWIVFNSYKDSLLSVVKVLRARRRLHLNIKISISTMSYIFMDEITPKVMPLLVLAFDL